MRFSRTLVLTVVVMLIAVGCGGDDSAAGDAGESPGTSAPPSTTTPVTTAAAPTTSIETAGSLVGDLEGRFVDVAGEERIYWLYIPPDLDRKEPAALVVNMHGLGWDATDQRYLTRFEETAAGHGFVTVYLDAGDGMWDLFDSPSADVEYVAAVVDAVGELTAIDADRVYAIGMSQGGSMTALLACMLPDRFAAYASVAMLVHYDPPICPDPQPARLLTILGRTDAIYSLEHGVAESWFEEAEVFERPEGSAEESAAWVTTNGCQPEPSESAVNESVVRHDYECPTGSDLVVYIHPGKHIWPIDRYGIDSNEIIWSFFEEA